MTRRTLVPRLIRAAAPIVVTALAVALPAGPAAGPQDLDQVEIQTQSLGGGVYMLVGAGGNLGLSVGEDGAFLIDDQYAPMADKIRAAVAELTEEPIRYVVNTHWHFDHIGGNEKMAEAGAVIVAHEMVRERMSTEQFMSAFERTIPPSPPAALPALTFTDSITFHWNGDRALLFHVDPAHTDGDTMVHFEKANVLHTGDVYFNGMYPFIDLSAGGSIDGMIAAVERVLKRADDETRIIPGHGPLSTKAELQAYHDMLQTARDRIAAMIQEGQSLEEIIDSRPTRDLDAQWANGFLTPERWVTLLHTSLIDDQER